MGKIKQPCKPSKTEPQPSSSGELDASETRPGIAIPMETERLPEEDNKKSVMPSHATSSEKPESKEDNKALNRRELMQMLEKTLDTMIADKESALQRLENEEPKEFLPLDDIMEVTEDIEQEISEKQGIVAKKKKKPISALTRKQRKKLVLDYFKELQKSLKQFGDICHVTEGYRSKNVCK